MNIPYPVFSGFIRYRYRYQLVNKQYSCHIPTDMHGVNCPGAAGARSPLGVGRRPYKFDQVSAKTGKKKGEGVLQLCGATRVAQMASVRFALPPPLQQPPPRARATDAARQPAPWRHDARAVRAPRPPPRTCTPRAPHSCAHIAASARGVSRRVGDFGPGRGLPAPPRAPSACHCARPRRYCGTPLVWELHHTPLTLLRARAHRRVCLGARQPPPTCSLGLVAQALALALMPAAAATPATPRASQRARCPPARLPCCAV